MFVALFILAVAVALILVGCKATRSGYESAPYKVLRSSGKCEVRDYPALTVVETPMAGGGDASSSSFNRLFRFITGGNEAKQKIAMTTPVFMSSSDSNSTMAFVLPAELKGSGTPKPTDGAVKVREQEAGRFAVLRYSGGRNARNEEESLSRLNNWMVEKGLSVLSPPVYAYFDPPWTPAFLRRNEVMLRAGSGR
jgi:hypothetical protein